jgi:hypothetical protein
MATGPTIKRGQSNQEVGTPWEFVHAVEKLIGSPFYYDLAGTEANRKAPLVLTPELDSLQQPWSGILGGKWGWLNPPFGDITPWVERCAKYRWDARIALLAPASIGTGWYRDYVFGHAYVLGVSPRLTFVGSKDPYPKDLMLCLYDGPRIGHGVWNWVEK